VVAVDTHDRERPLEPELVEFEALIEAAGATVVDRIVQRRTSVDPASLIGRGKVDDVAQLVEDTGAQVVFFLNELRPRQRKNLEARIAVPIIDRTMLILDVFAQHARSREGKLQVELAQLRYRQSNLIGAGADLSRLGGGIGTRGPGETKLEVDRRRIGTRISKLREALEDVRRSRATRRSAPHREPLIALVGYTNVGKSSLLNRLAQSDALVADQPFATLDPTLRRAYLAPNVAARVADTVGFITALPQELITAFRATLEELEDAELLVHVVDIAHPDWPRQKSSVESILRDLHLDTKRRLLVFNKCDRVAIDSPQADALCISARSGEGVEALKARLAELLA